MYYPLLIELNAKQVLIIGGGKIGLRKAEELSSAGAAITLIAPERSEAWDALPHAWLREPYVDQSLDGYFFGDLRHRRSGAERENRIALLGKRYFYATIRRAAREI